MAITEALRHGSGILDSKVNSRTGSILVTHDQSTSAAAIALVIASACSNGPHNIAANASLTAWRPPTELATGMTMAVAAAGASLVRILTLGSAVNGIAAGGGGLGAVRPLALVGIGVSTLAYIEFRRRSTHVWRRRGLTASSDAMLAATNALLGADMSHIDALTAENGITRMLSDVGDLERAFESAGELALLAANTILLTSAFAVLAPRFIWIPALALGTMAIVLSAGAASEDAADTGALALAQQRVLESFEALPTVRSNGLETEMVDRVAAALDGHVLAEDRNVAVVQRDPLRLETITMFGVAATTIVAAASLSGVAMSPGRYIALMMISGHLFYPFSHISIPLANVRKGWVAHRRLAQLARTPPEEDVVATNSALAEAPLANAPRLEFDGVSFTYPGGKSAALNGVSLEVPAGSFAAIVGRSGSGKSTLTRLLLRFYEPDGGNITLDDQDIRHIAKRDLRRSIGWVDQRSFLFDGSIAYNIALADDSVSRDDVEHVAGLAAIDDFAPLLLGGYDAEIGQRGSRLSDGQRQRVLLARALLKPSPLVILDEATAALDADTERRVLANVRAQTRHRTLIVIAHHLASIQDADMIVVMDAGSVVSSGTHANLVVDCPHYRRLLDEHG